MWPLKNNQALSRIAWAWSNINNLNKNKVEIWFLPNDSSEFQFIWNQKLQNYAARMLQPETAQHIDMQQTLKSALDIASW